MNGLAISRLRMPPLVVTLATLAIYHGLAVGLMGNQQTISGFPEGSDWLGQGSFGPVPHQFVLWLVLTLAAGLALYRTPFGRYIYAIGGNETATRLAGVPVDRMRFTIYLLAGLASGLAAVVYVSRLGSSTPDAGGDMTLDVISAIVLGGTDVAGGDGGIAGSVLGILILTVLRNGMDLLDYPAERQTLVVGLLLIATIALDRLVRRRARA